MQQVSKLQVVLVVMFAVLCVSIGETLLSAGMKQVGKLDLSGIRFAGAAILNGRVLFGTALMTVFFALYALALSWADFSFVLPLTAISYLFGALLAKWYLHETVTFTRWAGIALITLGVIVVGLGHKS